MWKDLKGTWGWLRTKALFWTFERFFFKRWSDFSVIYSCNYDYNLTLKLWNSPSENLTLGKVFFLIKPSWLEWCFRPSEDWISIYLLKEIKLQRKPGFSCFQSYDLKQTYKNYSDFNLTLGLKVILTSMSEHIFLIKKLGSSVKTRNNY